MLRFLIVTICSLLLFSCNPPVKDLGNNELTPSQLDQLESFTESFELNLEAITLAGTSNFQTLSASSRVSLGKMVSQLKSANCTYKSETQATDPIRGNQLVKMEGTNCPIQFLFSKTLANNLNTQDINYRLDYSVGEKYFQTLNQVDFFNIQGAYRVNRTVGGNLIEANMRGSVRHQDLGLVNLQYTKNGKMNQEGGSIKGEYLISFKDFKVSAQATKTYNSVGEVISSNYLINNRVMSEKDFSTLIGRSFINLSDGNKPDSL